MKSDQTGAVLATILILLIILSLLGIRSMDIAKTEMNLIIYSKTQFETFQMAEIGLQNAEKMLSTDSGIIPCYYRTVTPSYEWIQKPSTWWQSSSTCKQQIRHFNIQWVIENIKDIACVHIKGKNKPGARYLRITARSTDIQNQSVTLLQTIYALYQGSNGTCSRQRDMINPGRQSWRQLI